MKKIILSLVVASGTVLVSCGGPSPATDVEGALQLKEDINAAKEAEFEITLDIKKDQLELDKEWEEETKADLLADYGGVKEGLDNLVKKVKANDEQAITDWVAYKVAERAYQVEGAELYEAHESNARKLSDLNWARRTSERLLGYIHDGDKAKDFEADKKKLADDGKIVDDKLAEIEDKFHKEYEAWHDSEFCQKDCKDKPGDHSNPFAKKQ